MDVDIENISEEFSKIFDVDRRKSQIEIINLKNDITLKLHSNVNMWKFMSQEKYPILIDSYQRILSCFGSTYLSETSFSSMKMIKSQYRTRLTDDHLGDCMRIAISLYEPEFEIIASELQCQKSH
ncbi:uncharacterized protein LOC115230655 [Octopus sinensis]|nr:uncharacterized protein LOC115230655 [Octopus sinensis]